MALATNFWMSSGVSAAGLNASRVARGTAGSSVTSRGAAAVLMGGLAGEMNTGRWLLGFVARCCMLEALEWVIMGMGFSGSALGVEVALEVAPEVEAVERGLVRLKFEK